MEFSRQEYWSGVPFPTPGDLPDPRDQTHISCISCIGRQILNHLCHLGNLIYHTGGGGGWVTKSHPTHNSMDCSLPGFSVNGDLQARILEWGAIFFYRVSSQSRNWTQVSCITGRFFTNWAMREAQYIILNFPLFKLFPWSVQANLGYTMDSVPDHSNKMNISDTNFLPSQCV